MSTIHQASSKLKGRRKKIKSNPLRSLLKSPQKKGVVFKCRIMSPKKPNSAKRKVVRITLSTKYWVTAKLKGQSTFINRFANVMVSGGRANDLPGVRYNLIKGKYDFSWKETFHRMNSRSKYGIKWDDYSWIVNEYLEKMDADFNDDG